MPWRRRLFISDLDGTLLLSNKTLGHRTRSVLRRFIEAGGLFTVATGRSAGSALTTLTDLRLPLEVITHNGAFTVNLATGQPSDVVSMAGSLAAHLFARAAAAGLTPMIYALRADQTVLFHGPVVNASTAHYIASVSQAHTCVEDQGEQLRFLPALSMIILDRPEFIQAFFAGACEGDPDLVCSLGHSAYTPGLAVGEVQAAGADKALAAGKLAERLGLRPRDVVAFGDNMNDLPLLRWAGQGYCPPGSAAEVLTEVAGRIAPPEEEGVARFMERILEGREPE